MASQQWSAAHERQDHLGCGEWSGPAAGEAAGPHREGWELDQRHAAAGSVNTDQRVAAAALPRAASWPRCRARGRMRSCSAFWTAPGQMLLKI